MEFRGDVVTLTVVEPETPSELADIVAEPTATALAIPEALTYTIAAFEVVQVGDDSTFVVPFWYVAEAVNCCWAPVSKDGAAGVMEMDTTGVAQNS